MPDEVGIKRLGVPRRPSRSALRGSFRCIISDMETVHTLVHTLTNLEGIKIYCTASHCLCKLGKTRVLSLPDNRVRLFIGKNHPGWEFGEDDNGVWVSVENVRDIPAVWDPALGIDPKVRYLKPNQTEILCKCGRRITLRLDTLLERLSEASELGLSSIYL